MFAWPRYPCVCLSGTCSRSVRSQPLIEGGSHDQNLAKSKHSKIDSSKKMSKGPVGGWLCGYRGTSLIGIPFPPPGLP